MTPRFAKFPSHGPENAEHELRRAYNAAIDNGVAFFSDRKATPGVRPDEVFSYYKRAMEAYRENRRLAAERWARTTRHLGRALWHEAKIAYLEPRTGELALLEGGTPEEFNSPTRSDTPEDLFQSAIRVLPGEHADPDADPLVQAMFRYRNRAKRHLEMLKRSELKNELLRNELEEAAHEYSRVLECISLAMEAEKSEPPEKAPPNSPQKAA